MWQFLQSKLAYVLMVGLLSAGGYLLGHAQGSNSCELRYRQAMLKTEQANEQQIRHWQDVLNNIAESNNQQQNKINVLQVQLTNERTKNINLINANNRITRQYTRLLDASASAKVPVTTGNESDAYTPSPVAPDRILFITQQNNLNHLRCIADLTVWLRWYQENLVK